jgi:hypothetical protein
MEKSLKILKTNPIIRIELENATDGREFFGKDRK